MSCRPNSSYSYSTLPSESSVRIINLQQGCLEDDLQCSFIQDDMNNLKTSYTALSYVWGNPAATKIVLIDGEPLGITTSLHSALVRLRAQGYVNIWADAVCINQSPEALQERAKQVQMMDRIYSLAESVIADVGESDADFEPAMELMKRILAVSPQLEERGFVSINDFSRVGLPNHESLEWDAWTTFISRPWFQRLWVVQECVLAKKITMICGAEKLSWPDFLESMRLMLKHRLGSKSRLISSQDPDDRLKRTMATRAECCISWMNRLRFRRAHSQPFSLLKLMEMAKDFEMTDRRDGIYGVLGLMAEERDPLLAVDYVETVDQVLQRVASFLISKHSTIDVLSLAQGVGKSGYSWLPDITSRLLCNALAGSTRSDDITRTYNACNGRDAEIRIGTQGTPIVRGAFFDEIERLGKSYEDPEDISPTEQFWRVYEWEERAYDMIDGDESIICQDGVYDAYWRTLIGDRAPIGDRAGPEFGDSYDAFQEFKLVWLRNKGDPTTKTGEEDENALEDLDDGPLLLELQQNAALYRTALGEMLPGKRFCVTKQGYLGMVPKESQVGDSIYVPFGADVPFIIRQQDAEGELSIPSLAQLQLQETISSLVGTDSPFLAEPQSSTYAIIGPCYVHGIMDGEALDPERNLYGAVLATEIELT
jgi:hypothetical protein